RRGRLSSAAARLVDASALHWRTLLVELLGGLATAQEQGAEVKRSMAQVLRSQRLPAREARQLRRALADPRAPEALAAELRGEATAGNTLTDVERKKVRDQLIDLAKTIPALAIFAAPGGMLLLPILLKLLPFNLLPSSFNDPPRATETTAQPLLPPPSPLRR